MSACHFRVFSRKFPGNSHEFFTDPTRHIQNPRLEGAVSCPGRPEAKTDDVEIRARPRWCAYVPADDDIEPHSPAQGAQVTVDVYKKSGKTHMSWYMVVNAKQTQIPIYKLYIYIWQVCAYIVSINFNWCKTSESSTRLTRFIWMYMQLVVQ